MNKVFVISKLIKVSVRVISYSLGLCLVTPTHCTALDITKTSSNNSLYMYITIFCLPVHLTTSTIMWVGEDDVHYPVL